MAEIWLWNSIATRKRSPSDGFLENGLGLLKAYLEEKNHNVRVIDWQKNEFYKKINFKWLLFLNTISTQLLFWLAKKRKIYAVLFFPFFNFVQEISTRIQKKKMKQYLRRLGDDIINSGIKIFGIKVWYGESFVWSNWLAQYIKQKDPSILLVAGGFHVTLYEEDFLKNSVFDLGIVSEGEKPLEIILDITDNHKNNWDKEEVLKQIRNKAKKEELKNLVYREGKNINVSKRYFPDIKNKSFPKYDKDSINGKLKIHVILDSFGCPWGKCNFCVHPHFHTGFYPRPVDKIISEIELMLKQGIGLFRFAGSETPPGFGAKISKEILNKRLNIRYSIGCRAVSGIADSKAVYKQTLNNFELMLKSGLRALFMGGECAEDTINEKIMNKGVVTKDIILTIKAYREAEKNTGIKAYLSLAFIYPTPLVDNIKLNKVLYDNLDLIDKTKPDSVIISPGTPFKNTKWYQEAEKFGFKIPKDFVPKMMSCEYVLYKPPSLWPSPGDINMGKLNFREVLEECGRFRKIVEEKGIPTDITDELFLMIGGAGYFGKKGLVKFKKDTSIDLVSSNYKNIERITRKTNDYSKKLAESNPGRII